MSGPVRRPAPAPNGGLEIYSRLALTDAQRSYDDAINRFPI